MIFKLYHLPLPLPLLGTHGGHVFKGHPQPLEQEKQQTRLLADIRQELEDIKTIQETMVRNFNAVVVMIILAVLVLLVNMFFGDAIGRTVFKSMESSGGGRTVGEQLERVERAVR